MINGTPEVGCPTRSTAGPWQLSPQYRAQPRVAVRDVAPDLCDQVGCQLGRRAAARIHRPAEVVRPEARVDAEILVQAGELGRVPGQLLEEAHVHGAGKPFVPGIEVVRVPAAFEVRERGDRSDRWIPVLGAAQV